MMETNSPRRMENVTPQSACTASSSYERRRLRAWIMGSSMEQHCCDVFWSKHSVISLPAVLVFPQPRRNNREDECGTAAPGRDHEISELFGVFAPGSRHL